MVTLTRQQNDVRFVVGAYRDALSSAKRKIALRELQTLANQQGAYLQIIRKPDGRLEAAAAREPGFLLGETVWHYLKEPSQLIFCEALPNTHEIILVVVRDNSVFLDAKLNPEQLANELLPLMASHERYYVITSGAVPLVQQAKKESDCTLPLSMIAHFDVLPTPLLPRLPAIKAFELLPLPLVIRSNYLKRGVPVWQSAVVILMLATLTWWAWLPNKPRIQYQYHPPHKKDPYDLYVHALQTPAPSQQLQEIAQFIEMLYMMPGWQLSTVTSNGDHYVAEVTVDGGNLTMLQAFADQHHWQFQLTQTAPELMTTSTATARAKPQTIYTVNHTLTALIDQLDEMLLGKSISLGSVHQQGKVIHTDFSIHLNNVTPDVLLLIANQLQRLPLTLQTVDFKFSRNLISGTIQLSVWGS